MTPLQTPTQRVLHAFEVVISVLRMAAGVLALVWGPAAFFLVAARLRPVGSTEVRLALVALACWLVLLGLSTLSRARVAPWIRTLIGVSLAVAILFQYSDWISRMSMATRLPGTGLWVPANGVNPGGHVNEFFMRGERERDQPPGAPVIALVGCSMILGAGVGDEDAPDAALERAIEARTGGDVRVFNFATAGGGIRALEELVGYAIRSVAPDLVVVYLPAHHIAPSLGIEERMRLLDGNPAYRLLVASHWETLAAFFPSVFQAVTGARSGVTLDLAAIEGMERFRVAADETPLMIVSDMRDASHQPAGVASAAPFPLSKTILSWVLAHPDVEFLDVSNDETWQAALTQPDHHWTPEGIRTTMGILSGRLDGWLRERPVRSTRHPPSEPGGRRSPGAGIPRLSSAARYGAASLHAGEVP